MVSLSFPRQTGKRVDRRVVVGSSVPKAKLVRTKKGISRRPVDQLGWIEDTNTLVVLSGKEFLPALRTRH
jgi:hypothetical protein